MFVQPPLRINCEGLSSTLIADIADQLRLHCVDVEVFGETIYASKPLGTFHYGKAWRIIDNFGVKAT